MKGDTIKLPRHYPALHSSGSLPRPITKVWETLQAMRKWNAGRGGWRKSSKQKAESRNGAEQPAPADS